MVIGGRTGKLSILPTAEPYAEVYFALKISPLDGLEAFFFFSEKLYDILFSELKVTSMENKETKNGEIFMNILNGSKPETIIIPFLLDSQQNIFTRKTISIQT